MGVWSRWLVLILSRVLREGVREELTFEKRLREVKELAVWVSRGRAFQVEKQPVQKPSNSSWHVQENAGRPVGLQ